MIAKALLIMINVIGLSVSQGRNAVQSTGNNQNFFNPYANPIIPFCFLGNDPVCSIHNITFVNECVLMLLGEQLKHKGWCPEEEAPPLDPIKILKSEINGYMQGAKKSDDPNCPICNSVYNPVCGVNGVTYANLCKLKDCARVEKSNDGPCGVPDYVPSKRPRHCDCLFTFRPTCGTDNVTYQDACVMNCAGQVL